MAIRNPKDFWTGIIYLVFGGFAFWIARDYGMGTASRMGPGYFPTVLSSLLMLFGVIAIVRSFIVPGEPIGEFAWKAAVLVLLATLLFGFLIIRGGLIAALSRWCSSARPRATNSNSTGRRRWGSGCWLPFVRSYSSRGLACRCRCSVLGLTASEPPTWKSLQISGLDCRPPRASSNLFYCLIGVFLGTRYRRAARDRAGGDDRDAAAGHLRPAAGIRADHAGRHLLRRAIRRLHHRDPGQSAGRIVLGGHRARRLPDGPQGTGRARRWRRPRSARFSPAPLHAAHRAVRAAAGRGRAEVRPGRVLLADGAGPGRLGRAGARLAAPRARHDRARPAARPGRHRRQLRRRALTASACRSWPTASASSSSRWACSASARSSATSSTRTRAASC